MLEITLITFGILILIAILLLLITQVRKNVSFVRCTNCRSKNFATLSKTSVERSSLPMDSFGRPMQSVGDVNYKVAYKCSDCGTEWSGVVSESL